MQCEALYCEAEQPVGHYKGHIFGLKVYQEKQDGGELGVEEWGGWIWGWVSSGNAWEVTGWDELTVEPWSAGPNLVSSR